ncbi:MAG TPA: hypothetical protein VG817_00895, partial [Gemmatimonadales bacterium]|nr:hypothetical protein [Gemmatimonadales bacterium]
MSITRRELLAGAAAAAVTPTLIPSMVTGPFPARKDFALPAGEVYLNSAYIHPLPRASAEAIRRHAEMRMGKRERR